MGWFYGFKLHLSINHKGKLFNFRLTRGNTDDRAPVESLLDDITGKVFGDRG